MIDAPDKRQAVAALGVLAVVVGAFFAGRFSGPAKVVEIEKLVEKRIEVAGKTVTETKVIYRDKVIKTDGTIIERSEERIGSLTEEHSKTVTDKAVERAVTTENRPGWRFGVLVGAQGPAPWLTVAGPLVLGVHAERRIVGGLSLGLWATTGGAGGGSVSLEF